jgi:hypothetical protein
MTHTLYAHMNKRKKILKINNTSGIFFNCLGLALNLDPPKLSLSCG